MTYNEAIDFLYSSLPTFHRAGPGAYKPGLQTSLRLAELFGNPQYAYPCIHIAGTNGKGSTAHTLAAVLQAAGYRTGLYTSPHIFDFRERIRVNGEPIPEAEVIDFTHRWQKMAEPLKPSFFELTSTMAFEHFKSEKVDIAVIETGLGGRLDSTNIITPILSIITNISRDHTGLLGDTPVQIAAEKAGIIKPGVPVVIGEAEDDVADVFREKARAEKSDIFFARPVECNYDTYSNYYPVTPFGPLHGQLTGIYQKRNAATVICSLLVLRDRIGLDISDEAVRKGFAGVISMTHIFGRWTQIGGKPFTVADTGHNEGGWEQIVKQVASRPEAEKCIVMGFVADKDLSHLLPLVAQTGARLFFSTPSTPRGLDAAALAEKAAEYGLEGKVVPDVNDAVREAREAAGIGGFVLIAGSNFLIADLKLDGLGNIQ